MSVVLNVVRTWIWKPSGKIERSTHYCLKPYVGRPVEEHIGNDLTLTDYGADHTTSGSKPARPTDTECLLRAHGYALITYALLHPGVNAHLYHMYFAFGLS